MSYNPYNLWDTVTHMAVLRDTQVESWYFSQFFGYEMRSTDEWIDFEKLPLRARNLAPICHPLAKGGQVYNDTVQGFRFKPAYVKLEETIDPLMPLTKRATIDQPFLQQGAALTPMQRLDLIKVQMAQAQLDAVYRRWEWLRAKAIIDGKVTLVGPNYPEVLVDFQRASNQTITLTSGTRFGDSGVSILDFFQLVIDRMNAAPFGGFPTKAVMGGGVWNVVRKDQEIKDHMDLTVKGGVVEVDRGPVAGQDGGKVFRVGKISIGGQSGVTMELWVNNETYKDDTGTDQRYVANTDIVFTGSPEAIQGHMCFGAIIDRAAQYQALPIFPGNWIEGHFPGVERLGMASAPLAVPINPNATCKATVIA